MKWLAIFFFLAVTSLAVVALTTKKPTTATTSRKPTTTAKSTVRTTGPLKPVTMTTAGPTSKKTVATAPSNKTTTATSASVQSATTVTTKATTRPVVTTTVTSVKETRTATTTLFPSTSRTTSSPSAAKTSTASKAETTTRSPPPNVKLCRDRFSTAANGTIEPIIDVTSDGQKQCSFFIDAPANQLIQMTCSVVNLNSPGSEFIVYGCSDFHANPPVVNRTYTSRSNSMYLFSRVDNTDWFDCKWTMIPVPQTTEYKLCRDGSSTTPNGTIQRLEEKTTEPRTCMFAIAVSLDQLVQISCSVVNVTSHDSYLQLNGVTEGDVTQPTVNEIYTLRDTGILRIYSRFTSEDWFSCNWTTIVAATPTETICPDRDVYSSSGKLQPNVGNSTAGTNLTHCGIVIYAPVNQLMQMSCSVISLKSNGSTLRIYGISDLDAFPPVLNRKYFSDGNRLLVSATVGEEDWFQCEWAPWNPPPNTTDFKICQQGTTRLADGTIQPSLDYLVKGEFRMCYLFISPLDYYFTGQRLQFSCSHVNLTGPGSFLDVRFSLDLQDASVAVGNRTYFSMTNSLFLLSHVTKGDQFECKWEPYIPPTTHDFKSCRDVSATTANGTLQPFLDYDTKMQRWCDFTIQVPTNQSVQFSCAVVNIATSTSYLQLRDWNGAIIADPPVTNQNYISKNDSMVVTARFTYPDWFDCQWTSVAPPPVTEEPKQPVFQVCLVNEARSMNGTIRPFKEDLTGIRNTGCTFNIEAPVGQRVQMTCSVVRMNSYLFTSYIQLTEMDGASISLLPIENEIYTSFGNVMVVKSSFSTSDWFDCSWTTITG